MNDKIVNLVNLAKASEMMNVLKSIHDNFCARYRICSNCPLFGNCASNAITESTRAIDAKYFEELHNTRREYESNKTT